MRCKVCGKEIENSAKFCKYCGAKIKNNPSKKKKSKTIPFLIITSVLAITLLSVTGIYLWKENKTEPEEFKEEADTDEEQDSILEDSEYEESYSRIEEIKRSYNAGSLDYAEVKNQIVAIEQELDSQEQIEAKQLKVLVETDLANSMQELAKEKQYQKIMDELNSQNSRLSSKDTVVENLLDIYTKEYQELSSSNEKGQDTAQENIENYIIPDSNSRYLTEEEKKKIITRLNIINGQLEGIKRMISDNAYCNDVLIQLSAVSSSVKSLSNYVLENHLYTCMKDGIKKDDDEVIEEVIGLFKKFNK